jgi:uncharacterized membrane protein
MRKISKLLLAVGFVGVAGNVFAHGDGGDHQPTPPDEETIETKFFDEIVYPIVDANCLSCHNAGVASGGHVFETKAEIISHADMIVQAVNEGRMPLGDPLWKDTDDATILLYWLSHQGAADSGPVEPE